MPAAQPHVRNAGTWTPFLGGNRMSSLHDERKQSGWSVRRALRVASVVALLAHVPAVPGQTRTSGKAEASSPAEEPAPSFSVTPLRDLLAEADRNNPRIEAARQG